MTPHGQHKPAPLRPVMPRVAFGPGGRVTMETAGFPPEKLKPELVSLLYAAGLRVPERVRSSEQATSTWLVLHGSVRFLVGTLDIGPKRGLRAIVRGIAAAAEIDVRHLRADETLAVPAPGHNRRAPLAAPIPGGRTRRRR